MIRKIGVLSIGLLCLASIVSCEEEFKDIGTGVVSNTEFDTNEIELELEITPINLDSVRADNINTGINTSNPEYWLGVYNSGNYKTIQANIISQLGLVTNPKTSDISSATVAGDIDSTYILDKVILKLPYIAVLDSVSDSENFWRLDSILGNKEKEISLKVYRNGTFLNTLDPNMPTDANSFFSDASYLEEEILNEDINGFTFTPDSTSVSQEITRHVSDGTTFVSIEKLTNEAPFVTIPLDMDRMKELFWDKFGDTEFSSTEEFNNYFRGVIVKGESAMGDSNGFLVPFNLAGTDQSASVDFYYTITREEILEDGASLTYKDTVPSRYSFPLRGITNSVYNTSPATNAVSEDNFVIQGTAGTMAEVKILGVNLTKLREEDPENAILKYEDKDSDEDGYLSLQELTTIRNTSTGEFGLLVNDAVLSFYVNETISTDKDILPQQLLLYTDDYYNTEVNPVQVSDAYNESPTYGGFLSLTDEDVPEQYTFRITNYVSNLLDGTTTDIYPLVLKVYNPTDNSFRNNFLETAVLSYNWNPRGVTLLNEKEVNGTKRAVLKLTYSEEK